MARTAFVQDISDMQNGRCSWTAAVHEQLQDRALAVDVSRRCESAMEVAYCAHAHPVFALAMRVTRDRQHSEDVLQEVFSSLWRSPGSFDSDRGSMRTWLMTIAHRRSVDVIRREQKYAMCSSDELLDSETIELPAIDVMVCEQIEDAQTRTALLALPAKLRDPLVMSYFMGMTQSQIAEFAHIPLSTVKSRTYAAMAVLKQQLTRFEATA